MSRRSTQQLGMRPAAPSFALVHQGTKRCEVSSEMVARILRAMIV